MKTKELVDVIREIRESKGWSMKETASRLGIDQRTLKKYEEGVSYPTSDVLLKYVRTFGVTPDYLFYGIEVSDLELYAKIEKLNLKQRKALLGVIDSYQ